MLIAHITDSHIEIPEPDGAGRLRDFERVITDINSLSEKPDLVIHTGDVSHCNNEAEYQQTRAFLEQLQMPFHVIPGNKDKRQQMSAAFDLPASFIHSSFEKAGWTLILLDTVSEHSNLGEFCAKRREWLQHQLENTDNPVAIFMHHPSFIMADNPYPFQFLKQHQADAFEKLVSNFSQVKGIFCGHSHRNTTGFVAGIPAMTLTAMSLDRRKGSYLEEMNGKPLYQLIKFESNGGFKKRLMVCK